MNASGRVVLGQPSSLGTELSIDDTIDISDGSPARGVKLAYSAPAEEHLVVRTSDMATGLDPETRIVSLLDTRAQTLVRSAGFTLSDPHRRPDLCRVASVRAVAAKPSSTSSWWGRERAPRCVTRHRRKPWLHWVDKGAVISARSLLTMERSPMLIDCDPGLDDAIAILTAAQLTELVGITTVNGNVGLEHTTHNALAVAQVGGLDVPVHQGAARPLIAPTIDAAYVHGPTGLGSVDIPELDRTIESDDAVGFILDAARSVENLQLVAVGPLTNIALALRRDPTLPRRVGGFTIMGGAAHTGNVTAVAEFNVWADPEAAAIVFREFPMTTMVGLDVTHRVLMRPADRDRLRAAGGPASILAADLLDFAVARAGEIAGRDGAPIHDATAVMAVVAPELFRGERRPVEVELDGRLTRGMTVVDERPAGRSGEGSAADNAFVLLDADETAIVDRIVDAIIALDASRS